MKKVLAFAAVCELLTGLVLLIYPHVVVRLLFAGDIGGAGAVMSRIAGIALVGLALACWPGIKTDRELYGMFTYSSLAMIYLSYLGATTHAGLLLWPAVLAHLGVSVLILLFLNKERTQL